MQNAQKILEDFITIGVDPRPLVSVSDLVGDYLTNEPNNQFLQNGFNLTDSYNYIIFGKFFGANHRRSLSESVDTSSLVLKKCIPVEHSTLYWQSNV